MINKDIRIAYLLQVHKNPGQLNKFIKQIADDESSDIYIHIDRKSVHSLSPQIVKGDNIIIINENMDITWSDISQVDATLCLLQTLKATHKKYDFILFKTGQDLVVRKGLKDYLRNYPDKVFMHLRHIKNNDPQTYFWHLKWPQLTRKQYDSMFHPCRMFRAALIRLYRIGINVFPNSHRLPENYALYKGSAYFCIPGDVAEYILEFLAKNPWYYESFKNALAPDESFFQTLLMNSPYSANLINDNLTFIKFGTTYKDNSHPVTLTMKDLPELESSGKYFARKFDETIDENIINYFCNNAK